MAATIPALSLASSDYRSLVLVPLVAVGCLHDWDRFTPNDAPGDSGHADAGETVADAGDAPDGGSADTGAGGSDAGGSDAGASDAGPSDAGDAAAPPCGIGVDGDTIAYWDFESTMLPVISDVTGRHPGRVERGTATLVPGAQPCSRGIAFPSARDTYVVVADSAEWDLTTGSVELWLRAAPGSLGRDQKVIARDAMNAARGGHMYLGISTDRTLNVRFQVAGAGGGGTHACANTPIVASVWYHVGINFDPGGVELYLDGERGTRTDRFTNGMYMPRCGGDHTIGLGDNENPWVFGADSGGTAEGSDLSGIRDLFHGDIDDIRISSVRRDFASYFP